MKHEHRFIPNTETLKKNIRAQTNNAGLPENPENFQETGMSGFDYHMLFLRLKQEGLKGKAKLFIFQTVRFLTLWQEQFNAYVQKVTSRLGHSISQLQRQQAKLEKKINEFARIEDTVNNQLQEHRRLMFEQQRRLDQFLELAHRRFPEPFEKQEIEEIAEEQNHAWDSLYLAFENRFRGSRTEIKHRLSVYLKLLPQQPGAKDFAILDIGCGRGEWLEILKDNGIPAKGIDINRAAISQCREYGLDVEEADALEFLKTQPEAAYHAITGYHIIEHLDFKELVAFLDEIHRVLSPSGIFIFETPNPANILVSAYDFYRDPSHINPLHPETVKFLCEFRGFQKTAIKLLSQNDTQYDLIDFDHWQLDTLQKYIDIPRDYAIVGHKSTET